MPIASFSSHILGWKNTIHNQNSSISSGAYTYSIKNTSAKIWTPIHKYTRCSTVLIYHWCETRKGSSCADYRKECRTALNRCGIGIDYCPIHMQDAYGCLYCYASMKKFCNFSWMGLICSSKVNLPSDLWSLKEKQGCVTLSSVTDPTNRWKSWHSCLELLWLGLSVNILTKSDLVLRDLDLLKKLPQVKVGLTITTMDPYVAKLLEPGAPSPERRMQALAQLAAAGIKTWIFIAPVVPGIADTRENLSSIIRKAATAGVQEIDYDPLNFYPAAVSNLRAVFKKHWPRQRSIFEAACREPYYYKQHLHSLADELLARYGYEWSAAEQDPDLAPPHMSCAKMKCLNGNRHRLVTLDILEK